MARMCGGELPGSNIWEVAEFKAFRGGETFEGGLWSNDGRAWLSLAEMVFSLAFLGLASWFKA